MTGARASLVRSLMSCASHRNSHILHSFVTLTWRQHGDHLLRVGVNGIHRNGAFQREGLTLLWHATSCLAARRNLTGGCKVTTATAESSLIVAVLCFCFADCTLPIFQQRPKNELLCSCSYQILNTGGPEIGWLSGGFDVNRNVLFQRECVGSECFKVKMGGFGKFSVASCHHQPVSPGKHRERLLSLLYLRGSPKHLLQ